jgi:hypothetical protein
LTTFFAAVDRAAAEYYETYRPELDRKIAARAAAEKSRQATQLENLRQDAQEGAGGTVVFEASKCEDET